MKKTTITHLFVDIGGVLLTNGWDHNSRKKAALEFNLDWEDVEHRHQLVFAVYEEGKLTLDEYLNWVVFYKNRSFTREQFQAFMFAESKPYPEMINLMHSLKEKHALKIIVVSNEARELNLYRIQKFNLNSFVDAFISSSFVCMRKPDKEIFRYALDIAQANPKQVVYIENTEMFVEVAEKIGIQGILHKDYASTLKELSKLGLHL